MLTAYYYAKTKTKPATLLIFQDRTLINTIEVKGKVDARKQAEEHKAKCWNF